MLVLKLPYVLFLEVFHVELAFTSVYETQPKTIVSGLALHSTEAYSAVAVHLLPHAIFSCRYDLAAAALTRQPWEYNLFWSCWARKK